MAFLAPATESLLQYQRLNVRTPNNYSSSKNNIQMRLNPTSFKGTEYTITEFPRPALRRVPNADIAVFNDEFEAKAGEMISMMYEAKGVGMAAPQIGVNENWFVYNPSDSRDMERVVCNPTITKYSEEIVVEEEGCLSLRSDETAGQVARSTWIETAYQNELGQKVRRRLKGFEARVFQHEYDHLKGILCYDRFPPEDREAVQKSIDYLLGLYSDDDALIEPDIEQATTMMPRPLSARQMPPLELDAEAKVEEETHPVKSGFGGFGAGSKKKGSPKEKGKKLKVRNGRKSENPMYKRTAGNAFQSRK